MPSKKFIVATLAVLFLMAGIFLVEKSASWWEGSKEKTIFQKEDGFISAFLQQNRKDSDSDGLMDWEEALWKTDLNNPDTDKDGTLDGEEVKLGRNPAMPGPDDIYSPEKFSEATTTDTEQLTETEKFSRNFLSQYLNLKLGSGGEKLSEGTKQELINSLIGGINPGVPSVSYTLSDIRVSSDNSKGAIRNYGNQLGSIFKRHLNPEPGAEIFTFKEAIEKNDESKFKELEGSVKTYEGLISDCLGLTVPSEIKDPHLKLINSFVLLKDITMKFQNFLEDPIGGWIGAEQYADALAEPFVQLVTINNYFKDKGIVFGKEEDGYFIQEQLK